MADTSNEAFFAAVLRGIGAPVTTANLQALAGVAHLEGANDRFNPLNSVVPNGNSTSFNSVGVQDYRSFDNGVQGTIKLLQGGVWSGVVGALRAGNSAYNVANQFAQVYQGWDPGVTAQSFLGGNASSVLGTSSGSGSGGGGGMTSIQPTSLTAADYKEALGPLQGLLVGVPELRNILNEAVKGGWAESKFQQAVEASTWYRKNNAATRQLISLKYSDPAQYKQQMGAAETSIENISKQLGVKLSLSDVNTLAYRSITGGWDNQTLQNTIGSMYKGSALAMGQAAQIQQQLQQLYGEYGVPMSQGVLDYEVKNVLDGGTTMDTYKQYAMNTAKSMYPSLSSQIDAGMTVKSLADPYIQQMGNILEINPNQIGLTDPLIKKALQGSITTTGSTSTTSTTPLWQFEQTLRADPRWSKTNNARDTVSSALTKIGSDFGFAVA